MAGWLIPTLKAILPHVSDVVSAVKPVFTRRKVEMTQASGGDLVQQQIAELQAAAAQNADHIKELAAQLQSTVAALEQAGRARAARESYRALLERWPDNLIGLIGLGNVEYGLKDVPASERAFRRASDYRS